MPLSNRSGELSRPWAPGSRREREEDLETLRELLEAAKVTPVIDCTFSLSEVPGGDPRHERATLAARSSSV
jgi:nucleotide-binding universal stress UspA family protein